MIQALTAITLEVPTSWYQINAGSLSRAKSIEIAAPERDDRVGKTPVRQFQRPLTGYQWVKSGSGGGGTSVITLPITKVIIAPSPVTASYPLQGGAL